MALASLPTHRVESRLLYSMGFELGNVHLATSEASSTILKELENRPEHWLFDATKVMVKHVTNDWKDWRKH